MEGSILKTLVNIQNIQKNFREAGNFVENWV